MQPVSMQAMGTIRGPDPQIQAGTEGLASKIVTGEELEVLLVRDTQQQRRLGTMLRQGERELRRIETHKEIGALKAAGTQRLLSSICSAAVTAVAGFVTQNVDWLSKKEWIPVLCNVAINGLAKESGQLNPFQMGASNYDCQAKLHGLASQGWSDAAQSTTDWIQSAQALERKVIEHLETAARLESQSHSEVIRCLRG